MPKVLLVEDDATMVSLLTTLLELEGFDAVSLAHDKVVTELLSEIRQVNPDLVFLDVHLRHLNGFDLLRGLRETNDLHHLRVLMTSGMDVSAQCHQAGADGFLLKPFMPDDLLSKIRTILGR